MAIANLFIAVRNARLLEEKRRRHGSCQCNRDGISCEELDVGLDLQGGDLEASGQRGHHRWILNFTSEAG